MPPLPVTKENECDSDTEPYSNTESNSDNESNSDTESNSNTEHNTPSDSTILPTLKEFDWVKVNYEGLDPPQLASSYPTYGYVMDIWDDDEPLVNVCFEIEDDMGNPLCLDVPFENIIRVELVETPYKIPPKPEPESGSESESDSDSDNT
jgi:hypothetical protein